MMERFILYGLSSFLFFQFHFYYPYFLSSMLRSGCATSLQKACQPLAGTKNLSASGWNLDKNNCGLTDKSISNPSSLRVRHLNQPVRPAGVHRTFTHHGEVSSSMIYFSFNAKIPFVIDLQYRATATL